MKKYGAIIINEFLIIFGFCGLYLTILGDGFMNSGTFLYYTVQSNILAMLNAVVVLIWEIRRLRGYEIPARVEALRLFSTIAITLTFLVFSLMLTPVMIMDGQGWYLTTPANIFVHNIVPILAILDWCFFGSAKKLSSKHAYSGIIPAFLYVCFVYICVGLGITFSGNTVPYFFLDFETYGWFSFGKGGVGVAYWIVILGVVLVILGKTFMAIANRREKRS